MVLAFLLTTIAGLATGIGSMLAFFKKPSKRFLSVSLGFSAGVMIYVSMIEIFPKALDALSQIYNTKTATLITIISFFAGMLLIGIIDKLIPEEKNPHEASNCSSSNIKPQDNHTKLFRTGVFTALAVAIHNFPEGLATFISAQQEPKVAIPIVFAIALHNIPEGIAVSVPIYYATKSRKKAFLYSFASGLSEPVGALVGYLLLLPLMNDAVSGILFASVAGIMVFISLDELLPSAREYGEHHLSIYGLVAGMAVMAMSLWMFI
ncbi:MAG: zinc transporter ZupT [Clostridiales bacterium]|jgi:ZIP family zinc transporter|nr:zinc transporter ZupT [Clostridiales bacterium]